VFNAALLFLVTCGQWLLWPVWAGDRVHGCHVMAKVTLFYTPVKLSHDSAVLGAPSLPYDAIALARVKLMRPVSQSLGPYARHDVVTGGASVLGVNVLYSTAVSWWQQQL
jgi:hypothetical protein